MRRFSRFLISGLLACSVGGWCLFAAVVPRAAADEAGNWRYPLPGSPQVLRGFDPPDTAWGAGHRGVDLAARPGQPVYTAGAGRVTYAGLVAGRGVVSVTHGALRTTYLPVEASVAAGQRVAAGDRLGVVADRVAHCAPDHCLHWGLLRGADYLDPLVLLGIGEVRLLPHWGVPPPALETGERAPVGSRKARQRPRAGTPTTDPGAATQTGSNGVELSLAGSVAVGSGSAALTGLVLGLGVLLARRRGRRPSPLPRGVVDLAREREVRRLGTPADDDHPQC